MNADIIAIQAKLHSDAARSIRRQGMFLTGFGVPARVADRVIETVLQAVHDGLGDAHMMDDAQARVRAIATAAGWPMDDKNNETEGE